MTLLSWTGPRFGLANRLVALSAAASIARNIDRPLAFGWQRDDECPADYEELFDACDEIELVSNAPLVDAELDTGEWDPLLILQQARRRTGRAIAMRPYLEQMLLFLRTLPIRSSIAARADEWASSITDELNLAVHIRRTDRLAHHRKNFFQPHVLTRLRAFGTRSSLLYMFASDDVIRLVENRIIEWRLWLAARGAHTKASYTIYADAPDELKKLEGLLRTRLPASIRYQPSPVASSKSWLANEGSLRTTTVTDAFVELLAMSRAHTIIRNNRSSTFSLVPSLMGHTALVPEPRHAFWREIALTFGTKPWHAA